MAQLLSKGKGSPNIAKRTKDFRKLVLEPAFLLKARDLKDVGIEGVKAKPNPGIRFEYYHPKLLMFKYVNKVYSARRRTHIFFIISKGPKARYNVAKNARKKMEPVVGKILQQHLLEIGATNWSNRIALRKAMAKATNHCASSVAGYMRASAPESGMGAYRKYKPFRKSIAVEPLSRHQSAVGITVGDQGSVVIVHSAHGVDVETGKNKKQVIGEIRVSYKRKTKRRGQRGRGKKKREAS